MIEFKGYRGQAISVNPTSVMSVIEASRWDCPTTIVLTDSTRLEVMESYTTVMKRLQKSAQEYPG